MRIALAACCLLAVSGMTAAATYKWTDAQGRTVYSDQPPPAANVKAEQLRPPPPPANPNAAKELAEREAEYKKKQTDAAQAAAKAEKARADDAKRAEACAQAKGELVQLSQSQVLIYRYNAKGEREAMDDAALARERARINAYLKDNKC
jgi:hypothetical protein